jgi:hypothetical protein
MAWTRIFVLLSKWITSTKSTLPNQWEKNPDPDLQDPILSMYKALNPYFFYKSVVKKAPLLYLGNGSF